MQILVAEFQQLILVDPMDTSKFMGLHDNSTLCDRSWGMTDNGSIEAHVSLDIASLETEITI